MSLARSHSPLARLPFILLPFALAAACVAHERYNAQVDTAATQLSSQLNDFVAKMNETSGTPAGTYAQNQQFYTDAKQRLEALRQQLGAGDAPVQEHINLLEQNLESLRKLHEDRGDKGLSRDLSEPALMALQTQLQALTTLEQQLRDAESHK
jgi:hypothetical protein